jgi:hypothetical protein
MTALQATQKAGCEVKKFILKRLSRKPFCPFGFDVVV